MSLSAAEGQSDHQSSAPRPLGVGEAFSDSAATVAPGYRAVAAQRAPLQTARFALSTSSTFSDSAWSGTIPRQRSGVLGRAVVNEDAPGQRGRRRQDLCGILRASRPQAPGSARDRRSNGPQAPTGSRPNIGTVAKTLPIAPALRSPRRKFDESALAGDRFDATMRPTTTAIATATTTAMMISILMLTVKLRRGGGGPGGCV